MRESIVAPPTVAVDLSSFNQVFPWKSGGINIDPAANNHDNSRLDFLTILEINLG
jgi:hypothetical protein